MLKIALAREHLVFTISRKEKVSKKLVKTKNELPEDFTTKLAEENLEEVSNILLKVGISYIRLNPHS